MFIVFNLARAEMRTRLSLSDSVLHKRPVEYKCWIEIKLPLAERMCFTNSEYTPNQCFDNSEWNLKKKDWMYT